jgi:hypothetical protein
VSEDQRGQPRPRGTSCDVGAFEVQPYLRTHAPNAPPTKDVSETVTKKGPLEGAVFLR